MKRIISIILIAVVFLGLIGCAAGDDSEVTLKKRNVDDYLIVETSDCRLYEERIDGISWPVNYVSVDLSVKSKVEAEYTNAKLTLKVVVISGESTFYNGQQYELSEKGEYSGKVKISVQSGVFGSPSITPDCYVRVEDAEGTVKLK